VAAGAADVPRPAAAAATEKMEPFVGRTASRWRRQPATVRPPPGGGDMLVDRADAGPEAWQRTGDRMSVDHTPPVTWVWTGSGHRTVNSATPDDRLHATALRMAGRQSANWIRCSRVAADLAVATPKLRFLPAD